MIRALHLSAYSCRGTGYEEFVSCRALALIGVKVQLVCSSLKPRNRITPRMSRIGFIIDLGHNFCYQECPAFELMSDFVFFRFGNAFCDPKPDIVHLHTLIGLHSFIGAFLCVQKRVPFVVDNHDFEFDGHAIKASGVSGFFKRQIFLTFRKQMAKFVIKKAEKIISVTPDCYDWAKEFYGVPESKHILGFLPVDHDMTLTERSDRGKTIPILKMLHVGRFNARKRFADYTMLFDALKESGLPFEFCFVLDGDASDIEFLRRHFLQYQEVTIKVGLSSAEAIDYLAEFDVGIYLYNNSVSINELLSYGVPIIGARMQLREAIEAGGDSIEIGDIPEAVRILTKYFNSPEIIYQKSKKAKEFIQKTVSSERYAKMLKNIYENIL